MKWVRRILRVLGGLLSLIILTIFILMHSVRLYPTPKKLQKQFSDKGLQAPKLDTVHTEYGVISFVDNGNIEAPSTVVFIHGSPGSSQDFRLFFQDTVFSTQHRLIALDRLGYGKEDYGKNVEDLQQQGEAYLEILRRIPDNQRVIWVGHSYGGAPAAMAAALAPDRTQALLLAAAPMDPDQEKMFWFNSLFHSRLIRWIMPASINMASDEKMSHEAELRKAEPFWGKITAPVTVLQGDKDFLSPMANLDYAHRVFKNAEALNTIPLEGQDHFFPFTGKQALAKNIEFLAKPNINLFAFYEMDEKYKVDNTKEQIDEWLNGKMNTLDVFSSNSNAQLTIQSGGPAGAEWNPNNDLHFIIDYNPKKKDPEWRCVVFDYSARVNNSEQDIQLSSTVDAQGYSIYHFELPQIQWRKLLVSASLEDRKNLYPDVPKEVLETYSEPPPFDKLEIEIMIRNERISKTLYMAFGE